MDEDELNQEESLTPIPGESSSRNGTANSSRRLQQPMRPILIEDTESDNDSGTPEHGAARLVDQDSVNQDEDRPSKVVESLKMAGPPKKLLGKPSEESEDDDDDDEDDVDDDDDDDDDDDVAAPPVEGMYDPSEFENLNVTSDIKELFQFIIRYTPQTIELDTKFKPFIPDFIPAVGDIDAFIKVKRPDGKPESLGLNVLDEPAAKQSDPSVLDLQLRAVSKQSTQKAATIKKIKDGEGKNSKEIDKWIKDISDLHRSKPPPTVHYNKPMPDIDYLMQEWPPEFEEALKIHGSGIPSADFDCDLTTYVDVICALLDIPVYKSRIQSLHVLFTLYSAFKNSQHFNQLARENQMENDKQGFDRMEF